MSFDPITAAIRFGCGLSPNIAPPADTAALYAQLTDIDKMRQIVPIETFEDFLPRIAEYRQLVRARREARGTAAFKTRRKAANRFRQDIRREKMKWLHQHILRRSLTDQGLRERLTTFWADHFTAMGKGGIAKFSTTPYIESAIRPHITGTFADMLVATTTAPLMIMYLDQEKSMGPNSERGLKLRAKGRTAGLNENLAREVMELHTLGVDGPYTQTDVRQLAELFTGMVAQVPNGFNYRKPLAEPGAETILGKVYGGGDETFAPVEEALRDLAVHPATAAHLARKLVVHFVSDTPDDDLVAHVTARYNDTGGDLLQVTAAMLEHPAAWQTDQPNVKLPFEFVASSFRALGVDRRTFAQLRENQSIALLTTPMNQMGQVWEQPPGPDGLPERDNAWITPQGLAARLRWAITTPRVLMPDLPDPRDFVDTALGPRATDAIRFASRAAESKAEGVGLILISPAFQRL